MEEDYGNVFKKACLIQLSTSIWMGSKMLDQALMANVSQNSEWLRGRKFLINPELLGPLHTSSHQARNLVQQYSLPFPITSLYLIPKESLAFVDERLGYQKALFQDKAKAFIGTYELAIAEAKKNLGNLFNAMDYPVDISSKFKFEWRFLTLDIPGRGSILSPEVYEREKGKFLDMMEEARTMSAIALREEFADIVTGLVDKLSNGSGQQKTIKNSMFNKLQEFIGELTTRNIFDDEQLVELANIAKDTISGISPYSMTYNQDAKDRMKTAMGVLKASIMDSIEDLPKRKIRMALAA
jgi:hypothetical protein